VQHRPRRFVSFDKGVWEGLQPLQRGLYLREFNVHVHGGKPEDVGNISGWNEKEMEKILDLYNELQVHGERHSLRLKVCAGV
jgi:hypothetical protein